jgi:tetratricopeptide (TPR) repeat protein
MKNLRGEKHHRVADILINLVKLYHIQGRYDEAKKMYTEAIEIYDKSLGKQHPDIIRIRDNFDYIIQTESEL